ncbi:hypothetical protein V8E51_006947 [Hyaloscypha variabilis]
MAPPKKHSKPATSKTASAPPQPPPNWPLFRPLVPPSDLSLTTLLPSQIVLIRNFWSAKLCKDYVSFLRGLPLVTTPGKPKKGDAVRVNDRFQINDEEFARRLWDETGLRGLILGDGEGEVEDEERMIESERRELWGGEVVGLNPSIRIYRYSKGQFFDCHYDESNHLSFGKVPVKTTWTLLLYLTSPATGCQGGETVFYPDEIVIPGKKKVVEEPIVVGLETGMVLLHKHGNDCMLHEGKEVIDGEKWVIRTDLCVKKEKSRFAD